MSIVDVKPIDYAELREVWRKEPLVMKEMCWPDLIFYNKQIEMIHSVRDNKETIVTAGNMLGKDFIAGFVIPWFFITHYRIDPRRIWCRVITTSVKDEHLDVLWGEISKFLTSSEIPLTHKKGGPLFLSSHEIRPAVELAMSGSNAGNYVKGQVSAKGEGLSGHHAEYTLFVADEASGVEDVAYEHAAEWAKRFLIFGNPHACNNFFYKGVKEGDLPHPNGKTFYRKVIRITAEDSPNVRYGLAEVKKGLEPSYATIVPGVLSYDEYLFRRQNWDQVRQCVRLDAEFYEGADEKMFPPDWLNIAETYADTLPEHRHGLAMGIDTAEGGDKTCWAIGDEEGLIHLSSLSTPDTSVIKGRTIALMKEYGVPAECVILDQGGGGKEHADYLIADGYHVKYRSFGESVAPEQTQWLRPWEETQEEKKERYEFKNLRAKMYWLFRQRIKPTITTAIDPSGTPRLLYTPSWGIPRRYTELRRQIAPIPLYYDEEGRIYLLPKRRKPGQKEAGIKSLEEYIGCSPDEADAVVLMILGLEETKQQVILGPAF